MSARPEAYDAALSAAARHARSWLASLPDRPIRPRLTADELAAGLAAPLPDGPTDPAEVVDLLAGLVEPGSDGDAVRAVLRLGHRRHAAGRAGRRLAGQQLGPEHRDALRDAGHRRRRAGRRRLAARPARAARRRRRRLRHRRRRWPTSPAWPPAGASSSTRPAGTSTGSGWPAARGCACWPAPSGTRRSTCAALPRPRRADRGRRPTPRAGCEPDALAEALAAGSGPAIVCLQAGNLHSGSFDPFGPAIAVAHEHGAWVHVDGAFGLWAAASPRLRHLVAGHEAADSWATDAHKTLNVPYDCGIVVVARPAGAAGGDGDARQLPRARSAGDPVDSVPELSRRARGVPVWAALRSLGRSGVADLVDRLAANARAIAAGIAAVPGAEVLNDVVFTQVCAAFGDDERTRAVTARLLADGVTWMSGSRWRGRDVMRVSVSNWSTDDADVAAAVDAVRRAAAG